VELFGFDIFFKELI
jgi:hypothetical protein